MPTAVPAASSDEMASVRAQLERVLAADLFRTAPTLARLLRYLVERYVANAAAPPKEYGIGVDVFGRGAGFDPRTDTIVRAEARRLRARLTRYYRTTGAGDPFCIRVPSGHYRVEVLPRAAVGRAGSDPPAMAPRVEAPATYSAFRAKPGAVPAPRLPLLGRAREQSELDALLTARQGPRLITLTGTGGSGKTRLAIEAGLHARRRRTARVYYVRLAGVPNAAIFQLAMLRVFGLSAADNAPPIETVCRHLSGARHPVLLILDNFEHLPAAALVGAMLDASIHLRILVTSRTALHLYGEREYRVVPLAVPAGDATVSELRATPAVQLFVQRAATVRPGFALTRANAAAIAETCRRLDGLPLGIELAAAQCRTLSPAELARQLPGHLDMRADNVADVPDRQRTLRDAIDWSHQLLGTAEQILFRRLAVFAGGFTLEAAKWVGDAPGDLRMDVEAGVARLHGHSLLYVTTPDLEQRYGMLSTVRTYALERLAASADGDTPRRAHAAFCLHLAEAGARCATDDLRTAWLARCDRERDNFQMALDGLIARADAQRALLLVGALCPYWERGHVATAHRSIQAVLQRFPPDAAPAPWARVSCLGGALEQRLGDASAARALFLRALATARACGDPAVEAMARTGMAASNPAGRAINRRRSRAKGS
ncbi:MAG TPA: AAA family ATPase [Rhodanobacteraceae bacterium]|nr:AAA family ATPase [Rhodanobacteraceae bacterium]